MTPNIHVVTELIEMLDKYEVGLTKFENALQVYIDDNWMSQVFEKTINALVLMFFTEDEVEVINKSRIADNDEEAKEFEIIRSQYETINELIYHFICIGECGRNEAVLKGIYKYKLKSGNMCKHDVLTPMNLCQVIEDYRTTKHDCWFNFTENREDEDNDNDCEP